MIGYTQSVPRRSPGFFIQALATAVLLFGSIIAIVWRMAHG
jgi:glutathione S-transferase